MKTKKEYDAEYYKKNKEHINKRNAAWEALNKRNRPISYKEYKKRYKNPLGRNAYLKRVYGITQLDYDNLLSIQDGVCAICKRICDIRNTLSVDHCHTTNKVRGLLCQKCNVVLGFVNDDPEILDRAANYLRSIPN